MFEIIYNEKNYKAVAALQKDDINYIVLARDYMNNLMFFDTEFSPELKDNIYLIKDLESKLTYEDVVNIKPNEVRRFDFMDYEYVKYSKLNFLEQLHIYTKFTFGDNTRESNLKNKIIISMKKTLYEYKNRGRMDFKNSLNSFLSEQDKINNIISYGIEVNNLIKEYSIFIKIKTYENMNLFEILRERSKIESIIKDELSIYELEGVKFDIETLKSRILPAVNILIRFKEELILIEIFNVIRMPLCVNPFSVYISDLENVESSYFIYDENAKLIYDYGFYENLGMNTQILYEEFSSYNPWEFDYMKEYLYNLAPDEIKNISLDSDEITFVERCAKTIYSKVEFYKIFMEFVKNKIRENYL